MKPGGFQLEIRQGRGSKLYKLESAGNGGWQSATVEEIGNEITMTSFEGLTLYPRLSRLPWMEREDVLEEEKKGGLPFEVIVSRFVLTSYFCFTIFLYGGYQASNRFSALKKSRRRI